MEIIIVNHGEKQELMKIFNVSYNTVRKALKGQTVSKLAFQIRKTAIERGGVIYRNKLSTKTADSFFS